MATPQVPGYALGELLGAGSSGRVHRATAPDGRTVAVKLLDPGKLDPGMVRARLAREVSALRRIRHPALIELIEADLDAPIPYLVFPLLPGGDLAHRLAEGALDPRQVRSLGLRVAGALEALHREGVVHRDVKCANVFLDGEGAAVLGDLGLVRAETDDPLTTHGKVVGSLAYMAPEVRGGAPATAASDLFSLGVVLLEAAGGGRPVVGSRDVLMAHRGRPPGFTADLDALVRRLLEADPARRPDAASVCRALAADPTAPSGSVTVSLALAARPGIGHRSDPKGSGSHASGLRPAQVAAGVAALAVALLAYSARGPGVRRSPTRDPAGTGTVSPSPVFDLPSLLATLEPALAAELAALDAGRPDRPGVALALRWLARGHDPAGLPEVVRARLARHDAAVLARGGVPRFASLLARRPVVPGSSEAVALVEEAARLSP